LKKENELKEMSNFEKIICLINVLKDEYENGIPSDKLIEKAKDEGINPNITLEIINKLKEYGLIVEHQGFILPVTVFF